MPGMLMGCCSPHSSVLDALLPYILGRAQRGEGMPPYNRGIVQSGWLLDTSLHQARLLWLQLSPLNKSLKVQSAAKATTRP